MYEYCRSKVFPVKEIDEILSGFQPGKLVVRTLCLDYCPHIHHLGEVASLGCVPLYIALRHRETFDPELDSLLRQHGQ